MSSHQDQVLKFMGYFLHITEERGKPPEKSIIGEGTSKKRNTARHSVAVFVHALRVFNY